MRRKPIRNSSMLGSGVILREWKPREILFNDFGVTLNNFGAYNHSIIASRRSECKFVGLASSTRSSSSHLPSLLGCKGPVLIASLIILIVYADQIRPVH